MATAQQGRSVFCWKTETDVVEPGGVMGNTQRQAGLGLLLPLLLTHTVLRTGGCENRNGLVSVRDFFFFKTESPSVT